ncbi:MAG: HD domain-containing protein [Alphaproteobacteria bacterium]
MEHIAYLLDAIANKGNALYGDEAVTQTAHALQCAQRAERDGAARPLIAAALLHDVGHLLRRRDTTGFGQRRDDRHERIAAAALRKIFGAAVAEPVRWHVAAKRYLAAVEDGYGAHLSPASRRSLVLQGGPMGEAERRRFLALPGARDAIALRRWDDDAKVPGLPTKTLAHYAPLLMDLADAN